jgi:glutathione synthase/RimK-type ligase-like ATP-grasp enzyme
VKESVVVNSEIVKKADYHKDTGKRFSEVKIPFMEELYELVKEAADRCPETPYIGWDVAISQNGPVLIEGNGCSGCFNTAQAINNIYHGRGLKKEIMEMLGFAAGTYR